MNLFTIADLEQFSGIKAHTIRIWEKRYNALKPERSDGNTRYYDNSQLKRLLKIVSLMDNGHKVSALGNKTDVDLTRLLDEMPYQTMPAENAGKRNSRIGTIGSGARCCHRTHPAADSRPPPAATATSALSQPASTRTHGTRQRMRRRPGLSVNAQTARLPGAI